MFSAKTKKKGEKFNAFDIKINQIKKQKLYSGRQFSIAFFVKYAHRTREAIQTLFSLFVSSYQKINIKEHTITIS